MFEIIFNDFCHLDKIIYDQSKWSAEFYHSGIKITSEDGELVYFYPWSSIASIKKYDRDVD